MGHAILHFLWAQTWGALLVIAFIGWGHLALGRLIGRVPSIGLAACVGLSVTVFLGALLNIFHLIVPEVLIGFTLAGAGLAIAQLVRSGGNGPPDEAVAVLLAWRGTGRWGRLALLCFVLLFLFRMASTPRVLSYPNVDDQNFYLAVPVKMMEAHHLAADPYSERRIEGSLGGSYFLQCLVMSALPLDNVQMADRYLGLILIVLIALALARQFELLPLETALFLIFSISIPTLAFNLTFIIIPSALWLALVLIGTDRAYLGQRPAVQAFLVGLMAGTLCSMKSIYLPHAALFCLALYLLGGFERGWKFTLTGWAFALLGALLIMFPWMAAMRATSGTWLYPVFGPGYNYPAYHQFPVPFTTDPLKVFSVGFMSFLPLTILIAAQIFLLSRRGPSLVFLALTGACLLGTAFAGFATGTDSLQRYSFSLVMPTLVLSYLQFSAERNLRPGWKLGPYLQAGSMTVLALWTIEHASRGHYSDMWDGIKASIADQPSDSPETRQEYEKISSALPKDGLILTTLQHPYLLDHLDEHIFLADWPGCAGLPPGWPVKKNGEALAQYLTSHSIRYLAYSYADNRQLSDCLEMPVDPVHQSVRTCIQYACYLSANRQYLELRQSRRTLYDDGKVFILDLSTRATPHS